MRHTFLSGLGQTRSEAATGHGGLQNSSAKVEICQQRLQSPFFGFLKRKVSSVRNFCGANHVQVGPKGAVFADGHFPFDDAARLDDSVLADRDSVVDGRLAWINNGDTIQHETLKNLTLNV